VPSGKLPHCFCCPLRFKFLQLARAQTNLRGTTWFSSRGKQKERGERRKGLLRKKLLQICPSVCIPTTTHTNSASFLSSRSEVAITSRMRGRQLPALWYTLLTVEKTSIKKFCGSGTKLTVVWLYRYPSSNWSQGEVKLLKRSCEVNLMPLVLSFGGSQGCLQFPISGFLQPLAI